LPEISVVFYKDDDGTVPVLDWISELIPKARVKCLARIKRLQQGGHELRRPEADYLRDAIYELRIDLQGIHYRILYFFCGQTIAVLSHGLVKEREIPPKGIESAIERKKKYDRNPARHTYTLEVE
jgi:phage-related protein